MDKDKDDQTGVNNKVPEHKVITRRSRIRTNKEAAYHDAEDRGSPVAERERDGKEERDDDAVDDVEENKNNAADDAVDNMDDAVEEDENNDVDEAVAG
jgi:hypothetical protein